MILNEDGKFNGKATFWLLMAESGWFIPRDKSKGFYSEVLWINAATSSLNFTNEGSWVYIIWPAS